MRAWTVSELNNVIASLAALKGARLQEVRTSGQDIVLGFYAGKRLLWLWADLNAVRPSLLPWVEPPLQIPNQKSPLNLFLRAHFVDRVLRDLSRDEEHGRIVRFDFGKPQDQLNLEVRLFPHGRNFIARADEKRVSWDKVAPLTESAGEEPDLILRSLDDLREQWLKTRKGVSAKKKGASDPRARVQLEIDKKEKAVRKVEEELARKQELPWRAIGDWLKANQNLEVPREWEPFIDKRRKLSWNIEEAYGKARDLEAKIDGTERRLGNLRGDLERLRLALRDPAVQAHVGLERSAPQPLKDVAAEGRTLRLSDELVVVAGKNASDNMKLLRRARSWDLWFHLRDEPGSFAILFRNKKARLSDADQRKIVDWLLRLQFGKKYASRIGEKIAVVVAECRHVHPIRGDRLGRVTYRDERTLIHTIS